MSTPTTPIALQKSLQDAYLSYFETAFRLRDEGIEAARRELITRANNTFAEQLLEPVLRYPGEYPVERAAEELGMDPGSMSAVARALTGTLDRPAACSCHVRHGLGKDRSLPSSDPHPAARGVERVGAPRCSE